MAYKTILVHLDSTQRCTHRVALAARWARTHGARLVGLVPTGLYDGVIPADDVSRGNREFKEASTDYLRQRAERISREFRSQLGDDVPHEVRMVDEPAIDAVVRHARTSDLTVLGQFDPEEQERPAVVGDLAQRVLMESGCPILLVPFAGHFGEMPQAVVIAWDGSREASVAVRSALPLLQLVPSVSVIEFTDALREPEADPSVEQLLRFLRQQGVRASARREVTEIDASEALLSRLSDLGADLLVMGGYGHTRFRELILGGVTRRILESMTIPVLMAH